MQIEKLADKIVLTNVTNFKAKDILDEDFSFLLISAYTTGVSPTSLKNILSLTFNTSNIETGEIGLPVTENNLALPCGIYGKVSKY